MKVARSSCIFLGESRAKPSRKIAYFRLSEADPSRGDCVFLGPGSDRGSPTWLGRHQIETRCRPSRPRFKLKRESSLLDFMSFFPRLSLCLMFPIMIERVPTTAVRPVRALSHSEAQSSRPPPLGLPKFGSVRFRGCLSRTLKRTSLHNSEQNWTHEPYINKI